MGFGQEKALSHYQYYHYFLKKLTSETINSKPAFHANLERCKCFQAFSYIHQKSYFSAFEK